MLLADDLAEQQARESGNNDYTSGRVRTLITNIVNCLLKTPKLPSQVTKAEVIYFHKKGDPLDLTNYRGIALQSVLYKLHQPTQQTASKKHRATRN
jgi:hypothetical protein